MIPMNYLQHEVFIQRNTIQWLGLYGVNETTQYCEMNPTEPITVSCLYLYQGQTFNSQQFFAFFEH